MSISDDDFQAWLTRSGELRCVLVEAKAYSSGSETTRYLSNLAYISHGSDSPAHTAYDDIVLDLPGFSNRLELSPSEIRNTVAWGDVIVDNADGERDSWLNDGWDGRALTLYLGSPDWPKSDFRVILAGRTADITARESGQLALKIRDKDWALNVPIQTATLGGADASKDQLIPLAFGQVFNAEPVLHTASLHKYQFHDGAVNAGSGTWESGVASASPSYDLSAGTVTLSGTPAGRITVDVQGAKPSGSYLTKCADIVSHIVDTRTDLTSSDLDTTALTAFNTTCPQALGLYIRDRRNVLEVIDELANSVGAFRTWTRDGLLQLIRLAAPSGTPVLELGVDDLEEGSLRVVKRILPVASYRLGYKRNWAVMSDGVAGSATEARREELKNEWLIKSASNSLPAHLLAPQPDMVASLLVDGVEAQAECDRRATLWGTVRTVFELTAYIAPLRLKLGDVVKLTHPRFGFAAGELCVVTGFDERLTDNQVKLELFR